jgi:hypothetical protein
MDFMRCDCEELTQQIGIRNILAISGGRVGVRKTGITLPVRYGYAVTIDLAPNDTYVVRRTFTRSGKTKVMGERTDVYCEEVGEVAYQASCYVNVKF